jgi:preprotein translocase subunit YajC
VIISSAYAQAAPAAGGSGFESLILLVAMFAIMYFLLIRPQMKRAKEQRSMVEALQKGDEVVAAGGLIGRITKLNDQYLTLEVAPNTEIVMQRGAVQVVLPKGTLKSVQPE